MGVNWIASSKLTPTRDEEEYSLSLNRKRILHHFVKMYVLLMDPTLYVTSIHLFANLSYLFSLTS